MKTNSRPITTNLATLAGGCFWCLEPIFSNLIGVLKVTSGYAGGSTESPTYQEICTGSTGHAECIQIEYVSQDIPHDTLLDVVFAYHDPTTLNQQGNDMGPSYRSGIYYVDAAQKAEAENAIKDVNASGLWPGRVVTEIEPAGDCWEAASEDSTPR